MDKKELYDAVENDVARFLGETHEGKDAWNLKYIYKGIVFTVGAYGYDRWLLDYSPEVVNIIEETSENVH